VRAAQAVSVHLQHTATHCNTLQHTATHCNTLQHTLQHPALHYNTLTHPHTHTHRRARASSAGGISAATTERPSLTTESRIQCRDESRDDFRANGGGRRRAAACRRAARPSDFPWVSCHCWGGGGFGGAPLRFRRVAHLMSHVPQ